MSMWVELSLAGGILQTVRNGLARSLSGRVSPALITWARFAFNLPFSATLAAGLVATRGAPELPASFFAYAAATAAAQLLGNLALVSAFRHANFAQSIVLHKLEVAFTAVVGVWLFGEAPSATGWAGIALCTAGVLAMNLGRAGGPAGWRRAVHLDRGALLSLACGLLLVFASFWLKEAVEIFAAANPRVGGDRFEGAAHTLFHVTWIEVAVLTVGLRVARPGELGRVRELWPRMAAIGLAGFAGSVCWFWAYAIALVAYVKAVGQVEALLSVVLALAVWREREVWRQLPGVGLVLAGIAALLLLGCA